MRSPFARFHSMQAESYATQAFYYMNVARDLKSKGFLMSMRSTVRLARDCWRDAMETERAWIRANNC